MNYAPIDFVYLDISILLIVLIICLSGLIDNCKSNVFIISSPILTFCPYQDSIPDLP